MKDKDFDKLAQDAFKDFEVEFDPMDWTIMQSKLRAESAMDRMAKNALEDYEVPFNPDDWARLEQQLNRKKESAPFILWLKGAEASIMALLLLFFSNQLFYTCTQQNKAYDKTPTLNIETTQATSETASNAGTISNTSNTLSQTGTDQTTLMASASSTSAPETNLTANNTQTATSDASNQQVLSALNNSQSEATETVINNTKNIIATSSENSSNNRSTKQTQDPLASSKGNSQELASSGITKEVPNQPSQKNAGEDGTMGTTLIDANSNTTLSSLNHKQGLDETENTASQTALNAEQPVQNSGRFSVSPIAPIELTDGIIVVEPLFELKKTKLELPYVRKNYVGLYGVIGSSFANSMGGTNISYGAGVLVESEFSKQFALRSGAAASSLLFDVNSIETVASPDGNSYEVITDKKTHLVVVELPVEIQYNFFKSDKWKMYATAGVVANFIASRTYTGARSTRVGNFLVETTLNSDEFERGLLEGSSAQQNIYLSASVGLGLERKLGESLSLYMLPTYRHAFTKINQQDFIHSFGMNIGIKTSL